MALSRLLFDKVSYLDPQAHVNIVLSLLKLTLDSVRGVVIDSTISFLIKISSAKRTAFDNLTLNSSN